MVLKTVKMSSGNQVHLPEEILEEVQAGEEQSFVVRVREGTIELIPVERTERAMGEGLRNMRRASLDHLAEGWGDGEDGAWNDA